MKVLFLTHSFPRFTTDPVGSFVLRLAVALRGVGVDVRVIAPGASGLSAEEEYEGIPTERFRYAPRSLETLAYTGTMRAQVRSSWGGRLAMVAFLGAGVRKAWAVARRTRPDVIHSHWWFPSGVIGAWVSKVSGTPLVTTLHGSDLRLAQEHPFARRVARGVLRRSARVTTVSRWLAQGVRMIAPDVAPVVAPMPVVTELFHPGVTSARERDRLLFVGKLNEQKGINHLLRALPLMSHPAAVDVVVGVGSDETEARTLASSLGISGRLQWHPLLSQAELAGLYRKATALVIPSVDEGQVLQMLDGMAALVDKVG